MDLKDIKDLYKFLKDTDLTECEVEDSKGRIKIVRGGRQVLNESAPVAVAATENKPSKVETKENENIKTVTSPMVGTFYRSPSPDAPQFVEMGTQVKKGQIVCIIEAMKLMNEVETDFQGKIVSIHVENGQPVEYGEPLFSVELSK